uniref:DUF4794 domain-containing protein n=1 Tax=Anopheles atroparvus TaxID=41427 RepID=A0AAG5CWA6_ANOAO
MRLLAVLYLVFLVQATLAQREAAPDPDQESSDDGPALTRRKRGWGWSSSPSNRATKRPIGWSVGETEKKAKRRPFVQPPPPPPPPAPAQQIYYAQPATGPIYSVPGPTFTFQMVRPTKSLTRELVKAALVVGTVGAVKAYVKPVKPQSAVDRVAQREARRHLRKNRSTTVAPATNETTTAVPLAQSALIPVMIQDANKLFQVVYVPHDKIPPGGIPIATAPSFPIGPGSGVPQVASPFDLPGQAPSPPVNQAAPTLNTTVTQA